MDSDKKDKIDQGRGGKDETWESRNWRNEDLNRPRHFGPRNTRNDAKGGGKDETWESRNRETKACRTPV
jgi:hypothetical protein